MGVVIFLLIEMEYKLAKSTETQPLLGVYSVLMRYSSTSQPLGGGDEVTSIAICVLVRQIRTSVAFGPSLYEDHRSQRYRDEIHSPAPG